jgi:hypothetical protein
VTIAVLGNDIEQTLNTYNLNASNEALIKISKAELKQWKGINCKQSTRWQHLSQLKARAFFSLQKSFSCYEIQQLILGTGTAIWWMREPH